MLQYLCFSSCFLIRWGLPFSIHVKGGEIEVYGLEFVYSFYQFQRGRFLDLVHGGSYVMLALMLTLLD